MADTTGLPRFPRRSGDVHKGDMGRILVVAGSREYQGAGVLAATAALRSGAGLVHVAFPSILYDCYASRMTEVILHPMPCTDTGSIALAALKDILLLSERMDTIAVGPGFSLNSETLECAKELYKSLDTPAVFDADALNALAKSDVDLSKHDAPRILTPHPGEFCRLVENKEIQDGEIDGQVQSLATIADATVVYKSSKPIIANANRIEHVLSGSAALATAGTGDVLTGIIAAMLHRFSSAFDAAWLGAYIHGRCGYLAGQSMTEECVIASDLFEFFPKVFCELTGKEDA